MEKEKLIEELNEKAKETARLDKKSKQFVYIAIPLFIIFMACWFIISFYPAISYNGMFMGLAGSILLLLLVACGIYLPIGKISEKKVEKYFKEKLSQRIDDSTEELARVRERKSELEKELTILKEIQNEK